MKKDRISKKKEFFTPLHIQNSHFMGAYDWQRQQLTRTLNMRRCKSFTSTYQPIEMPVIDNNDLSSNESHYAALLNITPSYFNQNNNEPSNEISNMNLDNTYTINTVGNASANSNYPPYTVVAMWRRTA